MLEKKTDWVSRIKKVIVYFLVVFLIVVGIFSAVIGYFILEHKIYGCPFIDYDNPPNHYVDFYPKFFGEDNKAYINTSGAKHTDTLFFWEVDGANSRTDVLKQKMEVFVNKEFPLYQISLSWNVSGCLFKKKFEQKFNSYSDDILIIVNGEPKGTTYQEEVAYNGQAQDTFLIKASWKKKYKTEWDVTVRWVSGEELKSLK